MNKDSEIVLLQSLLPKVRTKKLRGLLKKLDIKPSELESAIRVLTKYDDIHRAYFSRVTRHSIEIRDSPTTHRDFVRMKVGALTLEQKKQLFSRTKGKRFPDFVKAWFKERPRMTPKTLSNALLQIREEAAPNSLNLISKNQ